MIHDFESTFSDESQFRDLLVIDQKEDIDALIRTKTSVSRERHKLRTEQAKQAIFPVLSLANEIKEIKKELIKEEVKAALAQKRSSSTGRPKSSLLPERNKPRSRSLSRPETALSEQQGKANVLPESLKNKCATDRNHENIMEQTSKVTPKSSIRSRHSKIGSKDKLDKDESIIVQKLKSVENANKSQSRQSRLAEFVTIENSKEDIDTNVIQRPASREASPTTHKPADASKENITGPKSRALSIEEPFPGDSASYLTKEKIQIGRTKPAEYKSRPSSEDGERNEIFSDQIIAALSKSPSKKSQRIRDPSIDLKVYSRPSSRQSASSEEEDKTMSRPVSKGQDCQLETIRENEISRKEDKKEDEQIRERSISRGRQICNSNPLSRESVRSSKHSSRERSGLQHPLMEINEENSENFESDTEKSSPTESKRKPSSQEATFGSIDQFVASIKSKDSSSRSGDRSDCSIPSKKKRIKSKEKNLRTIKELPSKHRENIAKTEEGSRYYSLERYRNRPVESRSSGKSIRESRTRERKKDKSKQSNKKHRDESIGLVLVPSDDFISHNESELKFIDYASKIPKPKKKWSDELHKKTVKTKLDINHDATELIKLRKFIKTIKPKSSDSVLHKPKPHHSSNKNRSKSEEPTSPKPKYPKHECSAGKKPPSPYSGASSKTPDSAKSPYHATSIPKLPKVKYVRSISPAESGKNTIKIPKELFHILQKPKKETSKPKECERSLENIMKHLETCKREDEMNVIDGLNIPKSQTDLVDTIKRIKSKEDDLENLIHTMQSTMKPAFEDTSKKPYRSKPQTVQKIKKTLSQLLHESNKNAVDIPPISALRMKEKDVLKGKISEMENLRGRLLSQLVDKRSSTENTNNELRRMYKKIITSQRENKVLEKRVVYLMQQNFERVDDLKDSLRYLCKQESDIVYTYRDVKSRIPDLEKMQFENNKIINRLQEIPLKVNSSTVKDLHKQLTPLADKKLNLEKNLLGLKRATIELDDRLNHKRRMLTLEKAQTETDTTKLQTTVRFLTDLKKDLTVKFTETKHRIRANSAAEIQDIKQLELEAKNLKIDLKKLMEERRESLKINEGLKDKIAKKLWQISSRHICQKYDL